MKMLKMTSRQKKKLGKRVNAVLHPFILSSLVLANLVMAAFLYKAVLKYTAPTEIVFVAAHEVVVKGPIKNLSPQIKAINKLVRAGVKDIFININSPGGRVDTTKLFLRTMRAAVHQGVEFTCVVTGAAASAALIIFSECDKRYALHGTALLWHSVLTRGMFTLNKFSLEELTEKLQKMNDELWTTTRPYFLPWYFSEHFKKESWLLASELEANSIGYLTVISLYTAEKLEVKSEEKVKVVVKPKPVEDKLRNPADK